MKQYKNWKKLLMPALVLSLALAAPLQASEDISGAEDEIIIDETGTAEAASAASDAPAASISSQEPFVNEIAELPDGSSVPAEVTADSEAEAVSQGEPQTAAESVTFYLDWNGIDGLFGHCLTCTREYKDGVKPDFTADDAAVYGLNFVAAYEKEFDQKSSEEKWKFLSEKWAQETPYGYRFLGWSTVPAGGQLITSDTPVEEGMSFYAYWEKDGKTNAEFQRIDPAAGPLDAIRIIAGDGTQFLSGTLHASKHAETDNSFTLNLFYTPVRAEINDITWNVAVSNKVTPEMLFGSAKKAETAAVTAGTEATVSAVQIKAEGCRLTITNTDNKEHVITVSATAKGADGREFTSLSDATLSFTHFWDEGNVTAQPDCETKGSIQHTCTVCGETKTEDIPALQHVYNKSKNSSREDYYTVTPIKEPTCTEEGENEYRYKCLRCGKEAAPERAKAPALGHTWSETVQAPASCNKDTLTRHCTRCELQDVSLVPAYHPELHQWTETERFHNSCMSDIVYERCAVCRETRSRTEAADNPDCHSYAYDSSMRNDCYYVTYTFKCVYGCGATQVMLKSEEGHAWSGWTTTVSLDKTTGAMTRVRTRTCSRCQKQETEDLGTVEVLPETPAGSDPSASQPAAPTPAASFNTGNTAAPAPAPAASSSTGNAAASGSAPAASSSTGSAAAPAPAPAASSSTGTTAASVTASAASSDTGSAAASATAPAVSSDAGSAAAPAAAPAASSDTGSAAASDTAPAASSDTGSAAASDTALTASSDTDSEAASVSAPAASSDTESASAASSSTGSVKKTESKKTKPGKTAFSYAKSEKKKKVTLKWEKSSKATGYQIQYSLNKKFSSGVKTKNVKQLNLTVSKLKSGKTYYFRIRAYKKSGDTTLYSAWSKVKKVTVK